MNANPVVIKRVKDFDRFRIPYRIYGSQGPWIICVNGAYQSMVVWHSFIKRFSDKYRIMVFDFPGQGKSSIRSVPFSVTFEEQVRIFKVMRDLIPENDPVYIVGLSWGGVIAASFLSRQPDAAKKLILASFIARPNARLREIIRLGKEMASAGTFVEIAGLMVDGFGKGLPLYLKQLINRQFESITDISMRAFEQYASWIESVKAVSDFADLTRIQSNTLLVIGEDDVIVDFGDLRDAATQIPNNEFVMVRNVGHFLHLEDESVFNIYAQFFAAEEKKKEYKRYMGAYLRGRNTG
jgi:pimeloyl-ACP methyl ester carboxylesterase